MGMRIVFKFYIFILYVHLCTSYVPAAYRDQKRVLKPLEPEFEITICHSLFVGAGN